MSDRAARHPSFSRAELLRQKREQTTRVPVMPSKKPEDDPIRPQVINPFGRSDPDEVQKPTRGAAVITSRSMPYSTPLRESVSNPVRKKVYRTDSKGVETRLPALPALHFSWQWVSGFLTIALFTCTMLLLFLPIFDVNRVQVNGLERVPAADIEALIQKNAGSIFTMDTNKVFNAIGIAFPELTDLSMSVDLTGAVTVSADEREPIMMWFAGDYTYWIDAEGVVMTPRGDPGPLKTITSECGMPIVKQLAKAHSAVEFVNIVLERKVNPPTPQDVVTYIDPGILQAAIDMSALMPGNASLVYDAISGIGWKDSRGWKVYFGSNLDNIEFKEVEYQTIVDYLVQQGITPTMISVEHVDAPYFKTK